MCAWFLLLLFFSFFKKSIYRDCQNQETQDDLQFCPVQILHCGACSVRTFLIDIKIQLCKSEHRCHVLLSRCERVVLHAAIVRLVPKDERCEGDAVLDPSANARLQDRGKGAVTKRFILKFTSNNLFAVLSVLFASVAFRKIRFSLMFCNMIRCTDLTLGYSHIQTSSNFQFCNWTFSSHCRSTR